MNQLQIGPVDIRHKEFNSAVWGYNKDEVHEFLEIIASQIEDYLFDSNAKKNETNIEKSNTTNVIQSDSSSSENEAEININESKEIEPEKVVEQFSDNKLDNSSNEMLISKALILAEKMKEEIIEKAQKEAKELLDSANEQADKIIREAKESLVTLEQEYQYIKELKKKYLFNIRADLQVLIDRIDQKSLIKKEIETQLDSKFEGVSNLIQENVTEE